MEKINRFLNKVAWAGSIIFLAAMLVIVMVQVVARYVFQTPPTWTAEAARYCMIWSGMLGASVAFYFNRDPRLFEPPKNSKRWIQIGASLSRGIAVFIFLGPVLWYSQRFLERSAHRTTEALGISAAIVTIAVPIAAAIILLHAGVKVFVDIKQSIPGENPDKT